MDINEAVLKLKKIEVIESQIKHLQQESKSADDFDYAADCNFRANELIETLKEI